MDTTYERMDGNFSGVHIKPKKYDVYLVETKEGTMEFGLYGLSGWVIMGDNKGAEVAFWMPMPKVPELLKMFQS